MLKKDNRLRKQKDFERVFGTGSFFSQGFLAIKMAPNGLEYSRFGFIVSNKVSKKAVSRNRIKRLLRETVRLSFGQIKNGFDAVIMVKTDISEKRQEEVGMVVDSLLKRSGLLIKK